MTTTDTRPLTKGGAVFSRTNKVGFALAVLLGLTDIPSVLQPATEPGPPLAVLAVSTVCGLVTVVAVAYGWARQSWPAIRIGAGARIVSLLLAMPAFFLAGLPGWLRVVAACFVLLSILTVVLMLSPARRSGFEGGAG